MLLFGPSERVLKAVKDCAVDLVLTDPPYALGPQCWKFEGCSIDARTGRQRSNRRQVDKGFMGKEWDGKLPTPEIWAECYRVLKPGGFILVMASPRNDDLVSVSLREAGFIKHNSIYWVYGSGFPKGTDVSKALDARAVREWLSQHDHGLTHKEVNAVVSAAVNGEAMPETYRKSQGKKDPKARPHPITPEERKTGAALIASLEARFGAMPKRVKVGTREYAGPAGNDDNFGVGDTTENPNKRTITAPATPLAAEWEGFKYGIQGLKPSAEVVLVSQKPFDGKPVDSIVRHGVGAVNVDAGRIATIRKTRFPIGNYGKSNFRNVERLDDPNPQRRYPTNLLISHAPGCEVVGRRKVKSHNPGNKDDQVGFNPRGNKLYGKGSGVKELPGYADADGRETVKEWACVKGCAVAELDKQSGERTGTGGPVGSGNKDFTGCSSYKGSGVVTARYNDTGTASRFFYQPEWSSADDITPFIYKAKASSRERNAGCEGLPQRKDYGCYGDGVGNVPKVAGERPTPTGNPHPTVKPVELMRYLIKLFIGKGRIVLDPFLGSGTTHIAADLEGVKCVGIDAELEYVEIAQARVIHWRKYKSEYLTTGQIPVVRDAALPLFESEE